MLSSCPLLLATPCSAMTTLGDVANSPACTVDGSPDRVAVPICVQCLPSVES